MVGLLECELWTGGEGALNQHLFKVTSAEFPKWFYYVWIHEHLPSFGTSPAGKATTMDTFSGTTYRMRRSCLRDVLTAANKALSPMIKQIINGASNPAPSPPCRDTLLPKLISGELRVKDADQFVKEATA